MASNYNGWTYFCAATVVTALPVAVGNVRTLFHIQIPKDCNVSDVDIVFDTIAGGATQATLAIWRDSDGDRPFVGDRPAAATQTITTGTATATEGGCSWLVDKDHHASGDSSVGDTLLTEANYLAGTTGPSLPTVQYADLWVSVQLDAGTARVVGLNVNWRC